MIDQVELISKTVHPVKVRLIISAYSVEPRIFVDQVRQLDPCSLWLISSSLTYLENVEDCSLIVSSNVTFLLHLPLPLNLPQELTSVNDSSIDSFGTRPETAYTASINGHCPIRATQKPPRR